MKRYFFFNSNKLYNEHGEHYNKRHVKVKIFLYKVKECMTIQIFFVCKLSTSTSYTFTKHDN